MSIKSRRDFLKHSSLLLGGIAAQQFLSRTPFSRVIAQPATNPRRPLRMLVLGDSVMWGQGLREENKFSYMVRDWLCKERNGGSCSNKEDVQIHVEAHSGATVYKKKGDDDNFLRTVTPRVYPGEVNFPNPTVQGQVTLATRYYESQPVPLAEVDLILVNGGINDVGSTSLIIPKLLHNIESSAALYCGERMKEPLQTLAERFPNARIVIPSYFPLVSDETPAATILDVLKMAFPTDPQKAEQLLRLEGDKAFKFGLNIDESVQHPIRHLLARRSQAWVKASNDALRSAVDWINTNKPLTPAIAGTGTQASRQRAWFVQVPFGPENAYGASKTYLWALTHNQERFQCAGHSIAQNVQSNDELSSERACMCDKADKRNDLFCLRAGFMHPNMEGAKAYRDSIVAVLKSDILKHTSWIQG